ALARGPRRQARRRQGGLRAPRALAATPARGDRSELAPRAAAGAQPTREAAPRPGGEGREAGAPGAGAGARGPGEARALALVVGAHPCGAARGGAAVVGGLGDPGAEGGGEGSRLREVARGAPGGALDAVRGTSRTTTAPSFERRFQISGRYAPRD